MPGWWDVFAAVPLHSDRGSADSGQGENPGSGGASHTGLRALLPKRISCLPVSCVCGGMWAWLCFNRGEGSGMVWKWFVRLCSHSSAVSAREPLLRELHEGARAFCFVPC